MPSPCHPSTLHDTPILDVVGAIIHRGDTVLLGRRPVGKAQAGCWEFVGGKIELGESPEAALARECLEELGLRIQNIRPRTSVTHAYPEKTIRLLLLDCEPAPGSEPSALEHSEIGWFTAEEARALTFCPADHELLPIVFNNPTPLP